MSFAPDMTKEAYLRVPPNAQHVLRQAMYALLKKHPEFVQKSDFQSTMWEDNFHFTEAGGAALAKAITEAFGLSPNRTLHNIQILDRGGSKPDVSYEIDGKQYLAETEYTYDKDGRRLLSIKFGD